VAPACIHIVGCGLAMYAGAHGALVQSPGARLHGRGLVSQLPPLRNGDAEPQILTPQQVEGMLNPNP